MEKVGRQGRKYWMSDTSHLRSVLVMGASVVALTAFAAPALAQTAAPAAPAPAAPATSEGIGGADVIVTAEHRQTRLQKVPVAVSVFTSAQRDRVGISTVQDVTNFAPGFIYDPANVHAYIRGVGRQSISVTDDSRVTAYEDEFFVYSPYQLDKSSLFLSQEQIERGPQNVGGRNAAGGSIDMISVRPTDTPYAEVRGTLGNYQVMDVEAAASGPVLPGLNVRVAGYDHNQNEGYYKNVIGSTEGNQLHEWYIEGQADWKVGNADLFVRGFDSAWDDRGDAGARTGYQDGHWDETNLTDANIYAGAGLFVNPNYGYSDPALGLPAAAGRNPADIQPMNTTLKVPGIFDNPSIAANNPQPKFADILPRTVHLGGYNGGQFNFIYHFPTFDYKNIIGEQGYNYSLNFSEPDTDVTSFTLPGTGPTNRLVIFPLVDLRYQEYDHWGSDEFSFQSTTDSPFQWTAGAFFYHQQYGNPISATAPQQAQLGHPLASLATFAPAAANPHDYLFFQGYKITDDSEAGYGQVSYKINDQFKVTGSIRYTNDHKFGNEESRYVAFNNAIIDGFSPFFGAATPSLDVTSGIGGLTCPTGVGIAGVSPSCFAGPLAKGVKSIGVVNPNNGIERRNLGDSSNAVTGGAGIEWTPTNDIFVYARYSRGYEDLTFNAGFNSANPEVGPEFLNSYELGYKQNFGHTISIDTALFYYDYQNFQLPISVANGGVTQTTFINVPKAQSTGIEFEGTWNPIRDLLFTASYSLDYTQVLTGCSGTFVLGTFVPAKGALCIIDTNDPNAVQPGARPFPGQSPLGTRDQSVKSDALPDAPRNKVAVSGSYTWHFDPGNLTLTGSYSWRDVQYGTVFRRNYDAAPSWDDFDIRGLWSGDHDKYEVIAYVRNVFNSAQYSNGVGGAGLLGNNRTSTTAAKGFIETNVYELVAPRTFGVEVRYKFF
jgi:iron complex outermembrane recepter protein